MSIPSSYISYDHTCRLCKEPVGAKEEIKYSTRHYAHPKCFIDRFKEKIVTMLPLWKLELLPYKPLQDAGLLDFVRDHLLREKKAAGR